MKYLTNLDLNRNELQNARLQNLATAPLNPVEGQIYYNTTDKMVYKWDGTQWSAMGSAYTLPVATDTVLGGVKVGGGLSADANGVLSTDIQTIKRNGTALTPDANKAVNVQVTELTLGNNGELVLSDPASSREVTFKNVSEGVEIAVGSDAPARTLVDTNYVDTQLGDYLELAGGTMSGDIAMGGNAVTGLGTPTNASDAATKDYVDSVAVGALKPSGSIAFASLPALSANVVNNLYNITDAFTTTADFVEGAGVSYPAGTNVAIINVGTEQSPTYKYDAMTGTIDTSNFATKTEVNGLITAATGTIDTSSTTAPVSYTGTLLEAYATQNGAKVIVDITISASSVVFTCASAPASAITCTVVSAGTLS